MRCFGPISNPVFAWILLDRALAHWHAVRHRAHAQQRALTMEQDAGTRAKDLAPEVRAQIDSILKACQEAGQRGTVVDEQQVMKLADSLKS